MGSIWKQVKGPGDVTIPVAELDGGVAGPTWIFTGAVHGDEYEGPEAIRRVARALAGKSFKGKMIALPVMNPMAYAAGVRLTPSDQGNLNRLFPGDPAGSPTQRWAHWLWNTFLVRADRMIDLHAGGAAFCFEPLAGVYREEDLPLAAMMGLTLWRAPEVPGVLSHEFRERRGPSVGCELGWGGTRNEEEVERAVRGLAALVRGETRPPGPNDPVYHQREVHAEFEGEFLAARSITEHVNKGDLLGTLSDWTGERTLEVRAPIVSRVLAFRRILSAKAGDLLVVLGEKRS